MIIALSDFKELASDESIRKKVCLQANYQNYEDRDSAYFWGYLVNAGYLKHKKENVNSDSDSNSNIAILHIPNLTARQFFLNMQTLIFESKKTCTLTFQHETKNLGQSCIGMFAFNASDLQYQGYKLLKDMVMH